ncbi:MAG: MFS transporter [Gemmatimonadetes bacterium]|nr:MFS transporter [Gemmatimonadota bacterium]
MSARAARNPFGALRRHRNFRIFWIGQTLSLVGTWMQSMAQGWYALELSNSALLVGLTAAAGSLPVLLFSLPAGALVDRVRKLRLVAFMQAGFLLQAALLWYFTWTQRMTIGGLILLATVGGVLGAFEIPARQSLVIELVGRDDLQGAIALNSSGFNLARIVGPAIAALVIAQLGLAWCFGLNALSFLTVLAGLAMIRLPEGADRGAADDAPAGWAALREGVHYVRETRVMRGLLGMIGVYAVLGGPYLTLMPVIARDQLGLREQGYGLLLSSVGVGGVLGALALAAISRRPGRGRLLQRAAVLFSVLLMGFAATRSVHWAVPVLVLAGFMMIIVNALANGLLQTIVPDRLRGRMLAAYSFLVVGLSQVLGAFGAGAIARVFGADWAVAGMAALMLAATLLARVRYPELNEL